MALILAGIDEAGYGPTLGPLCVGLAVFRMDIATGEGVPDLWTCLERVVCREPGRGGKRDSKGRIAVGDSKELKLSNSAKTVHPLIHLERAVLAFASALGGLEAPPPHDIALLSLLGSTLGKTEAEAGWHPSGQTVAARHHHTCYGGEPISLPLAQSLGELAIACSILRGGLHGAGVSIERLEAITMGERDYNAIVSETQNKSETTIAAFGTHLRSVWRHCCNPCEHQSDSPAHRVGVVCDRLGGRASYTAMLERELKDACVEVVEESDRRSRYIITAKPNCPPRRMGVCFLTESERSHLPVALASMTAKYVRELAMLRFNRHWSSLYREVNGKDIAPTAGYATDARRWLHEIGADVLGKSDRDALVRIA